MKSLIILALVLITTCLASCGADDRKSSPTAVEALVETATLPEEKESGQDGTDGEDGTDGLNANEYKILDGNGNVIGNYAGITFESIVLEYMGKFINLIEIRENLEKPIIVATSGNQRCKYSAVDCSGSCFIHQGHGSLFYFAGPDGIYEVGTEREYMEDFTAASEWIDGQCVASNGTMRATRATKVVELDHLIDIPYPISVESQEVTR